MKKIFLLATIAVMVVSCNNQPQDKSASADSSTQKTDQDLLAQAKGVFLPLPATAENVDNPITPEKVALGKKLFFDTRLSLKGNNSCNSCHNLETYGVDNQQFSKGDAGKLGGRNSPSVYNAGFHFAQFWDGRAKDLEEQAGGPILNPVEMAIPSKEFLEKRLKGVAEYAPLFKAAYPSDKEPLTYLNIQKSIAAFERTLVTPSPFDAFLNGDQSALTAQQQDGLKTFMSVGCVQCHSGVALGGAMFMKFGLFADYRALCNSKSDDEGRKKVTNAEADKDMFKVPSLRNVCKTAPYFHDGSIADLNQAVTIMAKTELNKDLSKEDVAKIVEFLNVLTGKLPQDAKVVAEK